MGKTFIYSCQHKVHLDNVRDGIEVMYPFDCYQCTCKDILHQLHKTHGMLHAEVTQRMGYNPTNHDMQQALIQRYKIDEALAVQQEDCYHRYMEKVVMGYGENADAFLQLCHREMMEKLSS